MYQLYCRIFQYIMKFLSVFLPWRKPRLITGPGSIKKLPGLMKDHGIRRVLIITDKGIAGSGIMDGLLQNLKKHHIFYQIYQKTAPNPTIDHIEEALADYRSNRCLAIIGFGGGSPIDCAKGVAARVARPDKSIPQMKGLLKIRRKTPVLFAVPTTAGTGSETTLAAVITDSATKEKYPVNDFSLIPNYAILDPELTVKLPPDLTAATGMDALTHAIEAYIGKSNTKLTRAYAARAVQLIFQNLYRVYKNGANLQGRANMQKAAYYAGAAFTRAYVGNVHAIAHTLGGFYSTPHGLANAVILPYVLEYYGYTIYKPLSELADMVGIGCITDSSKQKSEKLIREIRNLNKKMGIPEKISQIKEIDIPLMAERAFHEANPLYPVPKILKLEEFRLLYYWIKD